MLFVFSAYKLHLKRTSPGLHIPEGSRGGGGALSKVWVLAACILSPGGPALPRLMILRFHRLPDNLSTGFHLSLGHLVSSGLIGEWL